MERLGAVDLGQGRTTASGRSGSGAAHGGGCRGGSGSGLGRVWARGCAKGRARWRGEASSGPFGRGRAVDEVHRRRTAGGANRAAGGERDGDKGINVISEIPGTSR